MAGVPGEVVVTLEADDQASPKIGNVGRTLVVFAANVSYVTKQLGIQNQAIDTVLTSLITIGRAYRALVAAQSIYHAICNITQAKNYATATSFAVLRAAMGDPTALAILGLVAGGAAIGGYAMGGGFGAKTQAGGSMQAVEPGSNVQVYIQDANFRGPAETKETVREMGTIMASEFKKYY